MPRKAAPKSVSRSKKAKPSPVRNLDEARELVIITGLSGSGKLSALKAFEDLGYYAVDNMPIDLVPRFAELIAESAATTRAALVVDVREGQGLERFPAILKQIRKTLATTVIYLEASEAALLRRFSETRRPHPLGRGDRVAGAIKSERKVLDPIRNVADIIIDTSNFNVHELRTHVQDKFVSGGTGKDL
ncbi:MAG TPA: RNase adapter RapZ, partial [Pseudacidobacterium sp.]|nr:RNase adapter RapZ [Pseudacidobacterium sp.]